MANTYTLIEAKTLTTTTANVTFSSIPQTYTDLKLVWSGRCSRNVFAFTYGLIQFNSSSANYTYKTLQAVGTSVASQDQVGVGNTDGIIIGGVSQNNNTANTFGINEAYIPNYTSSNFKSVTAQGVSEDNSATTGLLMTAGLWSDTSAITSITVKSWQSGYFDYLTDSTFYLYGIKNS